MPTRIKHLTTLIKITNLKSNEIVYNLILFIFKSIFIITKYVENIKSNLKEIKTCIFTVDIWNENLSQRLIFENNRILYN